MAAPVKADVIYYNTPSDFELEFNICGCCTMRLLSGKPHSQQEFLRTLSVAVARSQIILAIGALYGEGGLLDTLCSAIGYSLSERDLTPFGIAETRPLPERAIPLVTSDGRFGGCVIECGPQAIIALTDDKALRHTVMNELVHGYVMDFEKSIKRAKAEKRAAENGSPYIYEARNEDPQADSEAIPDTVIDFTELENEFLKEEAENKGGFRRKFLTVLSVFLFILIGAFAYFGYAEPLIIENTYEKYRLLHDNPEPQSDSIMLDSMCGLYSENTDTVGFLSIDGTKTAYPVTHGNAKSDNYYQTHLFNGKFSHLYGNPYTVNNIDESSYNRNIIIFGKATHPNLMFGSLYALSELDGYRRAPLIRFDTLYDSGTYKIFAVLKSDTAVDAELLQTEFRNNTDFFEYVTLLRNRSDINTTVDVLPNDEIITLVSYGKQSQTLVAARKLRLGESENVNTQDASEKEDLLTSTEKDSTYDNTVSVIHTKETPYQQYAAEYEQTAPLSEEDANINAAAFQKGENTAEVMTAENTEELIGGQLLTVTDAASGQRVTGSTNDILCRMVEAEMTSKSESEALKAQAIASYGWLLTNGAANGKAPTVKLETPQLKVTNAVHEVLGLKPYRGSTVAQTVYFPCSAGFTADCKTLFGTELGFGTADSSEDKNSESFISRRVYKAQDIKAWVLEETGIDLSAVTAKEKWLNITYCEDGFYVSHVTFGNDKDCYDARFVRERLISKQRVGDGNGLLSTAFRITYQSKSDTFIFEVRGNGHGVGMSQYGANALARQGMTYLQILNHYYSGIEISY